MAARGTGPGGLAARYAAALFELAEDHKQIDRIAQDLAELKAMIAGSDELRAVLRSPVLSRDEQSGALSAVLERAGASDLIRKFIGLVAANRRLFVLTQMIDAFLAQLAARHGEIHAEVAAARSLSDAQQQALAEAIRRAIGGKVAVEVKVDAGLIGGLVVKVGSRMVDSSLRTKLQKLQLAMKRVG